MNTPTIGLDTVTMQKEEYARLINGLEGLETLAAIYLDAKVFVEHPTPEDTKTIADALEAYAYVRELPDTDYGRIKFLMQELYTQITVHCIMKR